MTDHELLFQQIWDEQVKHTEQDERNRGYDQSLWYVSGRASKEFPNKENQDWWAVKGPGFVKSWITWRDNCGMDIWTTPDGKPGIEVRTMATCPWDETLTLMSVIDRVFIDQEGDLRIVDIKSGSQTAAWPRQLAMNNLGLEQEYGLTARWGGFWDARKGGVMEWTDLRIYDSAWMWRQVEMAREIRDRGLFLAQPTNLCKSACSVKDYCKAMGGPLSLSVVQP